MKLLIVAATLQELSGVFAHFGLAPLNFVQHENFDVVITGVGMTATAFALGKILHNGYSVVLNVGIAGSFDPNIPIGNLVQVSSDCFAELGAEDHDSFITINDLGFGTNTFAASTIIPTLPQVKGITVNTVHGSAESIAKVSHLFNVQIESMEGAAVFYACHQEGIPCAQVRAISNYVEPRNKENWQIGLAVKNLNDWLITYLSLLA